MSDIIKGETRDFEEITWENIVKIKEVRDCMKKFCLSDPEKRNSFVNMIKKHEADLDVNTITDKYILSYVARSMMSDYGYADRIHSLSMRYRKLQEG